MLNEISCEKLMEITKFLADNVFRNEDIMYGEVPTIKLNDGIEVELTDVIASLHNYLCQAVTGRRYNYMFHWANKIGVQGVYDDIFNVPYDSPEEWLKG